MKRRPSAAAGRMLRTGALLASMAIASPVLHACGQTAGPLQAAPPPLDPDQWYAIDPARVEPKPLYSKSELRSYVRAGLAALKIEVEWRPRIRSAAHPDEARELRRLARAEMMRAVERAGIGIERYNQINDAERTNPQIHELVLPYRRAFSETGG